MMQGYLEKSSVHWKTYRKRWVVCKDNCLYSYRSSEDAMDLDDDAKCTEIINLNLFEYVEKINKDQFKLISENKTKTRKFIAPTRREMCEWVNYIKHVSNIYELEKCDNERKDSLDSIVLELSEDEILWNDSDKIWEYYWKSDGIKGTHGPFSCAEMAKRYKLYFEKAEEPIVFRMIKNGNWNFWADSSTMNLMLELKQYNVHKAETNVDDTHDSSMEWITVQGEVGLTDTLPSGWIELKDNDGTPYYHDYNSGNAQWQKPEVRN